MTERINARLEDEVARKLAYVRERMGATTSEALRASIEAYYEQLRTHDDPAQLLSGFTGCCEGPRNLAADYERGLSRSRAAKGRES